MPPPPPCLNSHIPPHLQEVCDILARGLVRLHSRTQQQAARHGDDQAGDGEFRLHFRSPERRHAKPSKRRLA